MIAPTSATPSPQMWLEEFLYNVYATTHSLRPNSVYQYQVAINCLDQWAGDPIRVEELGDVLVNQWLTHLEAKGMAPATIRNRRTHLLTLWHAAHKAGLCANRARDIRVSKVPYNPPAAWRYDDVLRLLDTVGKLKGTYPGHRWQMDQTDRYRRAKDKHKMARSVFWGLLVRLAWDTGLRMGDLFELSVSEFNAEGHCEIVQRKTRRWHLVKVHPETLQCVRASFPPRREFIVEWHASPELFRREFKSIAKSAGLDGTFKKLRKSSASEVELNYPGCGAAHLGHTIGVARANYLDPRILIETKPMPRPLREISTEGGVANA